MTESMMNELLRRLEERTARVAVIGQGYVGLPLAMRASEVGFPVVGYELSTEVFGLDPERLHAMEDASFYVAVLHGANTSAKSLRGRWWAADHAITAGVELAGRIGLACTDKIGWTSTAVYGAFGAAAAALMAALSRKVVPVSSGSERPSSPAELALIP